MLWITGIGGIIGAVVFGLRGDFPYLYDTCVADERTKMWICLAIAVVSIILGFGMACLGTREETKKTEIRKLAAISSGTKLEGSYSGGIFVTSGKLVEKEVYRYFYYLDDGSMMKDNVPSGITKIWQEADCKDPRLDQYTVYTTCKNNAVELLHLILTFNKREVITYEFHVPTGTVVEEFRLEA